jgi:hypothetical protein
MLLINQDLDGAFNKFTWEMHLVPENLSTCAEIEFSEKPLKTPNGMSAEATKKGSTVKKAFLKIFPLTRHSSNASHISAAIIRE